MSSSLLKTLTASSALIKPVDISARPLRLLASLRLLGLNLVKLSERLVIATSRLVRAAFSLSNLSLIAILSNPRFSAVFSITSEPRELDKLTLSNANYHSLDLNRSITNSVMTSSYLILKDGTSNFRCVIITKYSKCKAFLK